MWRATRSPRRGIRHERHNPKGPEMSEVRAVKIESEFTVHATPERVFHAYCQEQHEWYPHSYGGERLRAIVFEPRVGGLIYEDWGDGAGHLYGTVAHYDPPAAVMIRSR